MELDPKYIDVIVQRWQGLVVRTIGPEEGLQNATCKRTLCANGSLMKVVRLNGSGDGSTDQDLDRFVESFPIVPVGGHVSRS